MEQNKQKNSKRRLNSLILLVAFTAIMLIVSTYAWFSTQRTVSISNLEGTVKVAEGLQISLDAKTWSQEVDFADYTPEQLKKVLNGTDGADNNVVPGEMIPASTTGLRGEVGIKNPGNLENGYNVSQDDKLSLYRGTATEENKKWKLANITEADGTETSASKLKYSGYYAIDLFLRNDGIDTDAGDVQDTTRETLQLAQGSTVTVKEDGSAETGIQNTPRVAFALYNGHASANLGASDDDKATIIANTITDKKIEDVAIWEPNANAHVSTIVTNYNDITWKNGDPAGYLAATAVANKAKYTATEIIPTYALSKSADTKTYADLYNWDGTTNAGLEKQIALQTTTGATATAKNLISVSSPETAIQTIGASGTVNDFQILKNTIIRLRMYVWLEGQDPDCVNYASHGGGIELNFGLCKGEATTAEGVGP